jgi:uncharacterized MnhB-related membrane protein
MGVFTFLLFIGLIVCAFYACLAKNLLTSIVVFMAYSVVMSIIWLLLESPDLAITEAAVGAGITSLLFFVTLKKIQAIKAEIKGTDEVSADEADFVLRKPQTRVPSMQARLFKRLYKISRRFT